ncbi:MAG: hypothetical protein LBT99_04225 [Bifidobacteriaceae bacterium]|jgi:ABC-type lipoprotein export system ATPase subunit|nr:hypothetical protein [Bifidobacteriaceae bacterium]
MTDKLENNKIKFLKLKCENRFSDSFNNWQENNIISFSEKKFALVYAPNGVGKTSFIKTLETRNNEFQYKCVFNNEDYSEKSKDLPIHFIRDFNQRNIIEHRTEELSEYILSDNIKQETETKNSLDKTVNKIGEDLTTKLKNSYGVKTKESFFASRCKNEELKKLIKALANAKDKGKNVSTENFRNIIKIAETPKKDIKSNIDEKQQYVMDNLEEHNSLIRLLIRFENKEITKVSNFQNAEIYKDAKEFIDKHPKIRDCPLDIRNLPHSINQKAITKKLETNLNKIYNSLQKDTKQIADLIFKSNNEDPFNIKNTFINAFQFGQGNSIKKLQEKIEEVIDNIEYDFQSFVINKVNEYKLLELDDKYKKMLNEKISLKEEDERLLVDFINSVTGFEVEIKRNNEDNNLVLRIKNFNVLKNERISWPFSTGEINFISLLFELLKANKTDKKIIIIDDPISSFDSIFKNKIIYAIINIFTKQNKFLMILTHNLETIRIMENQHNNVHNMYLLNNYKDGNNGFIPIECEDKKLLFKISEIIKFFKEPNEKIIDENQFLMSAIPFMRDWAKIINKNCIYKNLSSIMHAYSKEEINIKEFYKDLFNKSLPSSDYIISSENILSTEICDQIVNKKTNPLLNRTLIHNLQYLQLRLLVENTLYNLDTKKINANAKPTLYNIIDTYLPKENYKTIKYRTKLLSKKTLLNDFNHFDDNLNFFLPSLDISNEALTRERKEIERICEEIKENYKNIKQ